MGAQASGPRERVVARAAGVIVVGLNFLLLYHVVKGGL